MTDLVERLREMAIRWAGHAGVHLWREAADEIERLRAEIEEHEETIGDLFGRIDTLKAEIERLREENKMLALELAEAAQHMNAQDEELKRLRMLEFELRNDIALAPLSPARKSDE